MNDRIKDYFAFNKSEQRGLIILLGLMLLSIAFNIFLPDLMPEKEYDMTSFQKEVAEFMASAEALDSAREIKSKNFSKDFKVDEGPGLTAFLASPFPFDPNQLSEQQWTEMGMNPKIIRNILRYLEKGGTFRDKEGFRKIYGMDDKIYAILEPYIRITEVEKSWSENNYDKENRNTYPKQEKTFKTFKQDTLMIELNTADSVLLLSLNGIGPSFAGRIIKYRNLLGGFTNTEQLLEIRGMDTIRFNQFREQVSTDTDKVIKIDLNTVTFKELLKHPYFEYYLVKAVFAKKDEIKAFDSVGQIRSIPVMYEELFDKIAPYLEVN